MKAGIALGSNLADRLTNLCNARAEIAALHDVRPPIRASAIYETEPVGCEEGAAKFLNAALEFEYSGEAQELLRELAAIEKRLGRPAAHERNVSRSLDLDLLYFGDLEIDAAELQLPHPRIGNREFVLRPLADISPDLVLPRQTESVGALLRRLPDTGEVVRVATEW
ncbi:MAG: 2-amino-4-hydroxy-6-hydroxymethyldihydropteridine diphosphokinase [Verrucomicrobiota bacterium]|nr:2-amino-4-hydroxy-6-hydroxymethyldihydropteridine diphosphokinase [Verrucomicrobiota bacterium]